MKNLIIRLVLVAMLMALVPSANIVHAEGGNFYRNTKTAAVAGEFYVSPGGKSSNSGTASSPWDLQTALNQPSSVTPGSTIWLLEGTYNGQYTLRLKGSASGWITVRAVPNHRVILSSTSGAPALDIANSYFVAIWGIEITSSYSTRNTNRSSSSYGIRVRQGDSSHHISLINSIVHDNQAQGMGWWQALKDSEIYGSLFYFNGTTQLDHGVYAHNVSGTKIFRNNIVFDNASHGFHGYAETNEKGLNNLIVDHNTFFNNGSIGINTKNGKYGTYKRNILVGGLIQSSNAVITNNNTYYPGNSGSSLNLGYTGGSTNSVISGNYFAGGTFMIGDNAKSLQLANNYIYAPGGAFGFSMSTYPANHVLSTRPNGMRFSIKGNTFEPNRAHITIYNWDMQNTFYIPASALKGVAIRPGQAYELRNVQDYFGDVVKGVYDGKGIPVPMTNHSVAQPMGLSFKPASTFPEFGAFVLIAK